MDRVGCWLAIVLPVVMQINSSILIVNSLSKAKKKKALTVLYQQSTVHRLLIVHSNETLSKIVLTGHYWPNYSYLLPTARKIST